MRALQLWSPLRETDLFTDDFDNLFERFWGGDGHRSAPIVPAIESFVDGDKFVVKADMPGMDPKKVEVSVADGVLAVRGSREHKQEQKRRNYVHSEMSYGTFERSLELPEGVDPEQIKATYRDGVLEVTMPAPKHVAARKVPIDINQGDREKLVEAQAAGK